MLNDEELKAVVETAEQRRDDPFAAFVLFVLYTATRRSEAAGLHRSELSDDGRTWVIPGRRYKSGTDTLVPLSTAAQKIVAARPLRRRLRVLGHRRSTRSLVSPNAKQEFDQACGVQGWRIHDLRRSARTLLSRAGVSADVAEMCLGHALSGIRGTYDRHQYESEKRAAFEALAKMVSTIVRPPATKVADIAAARKRQRL